MEKLALGIDIGGTKVAFGIVNSLGTILLEKNVNTKDFPQAIDLVNFLFIELENLKLSSEIIGIGIGAPNGNQITGTIDFAPNLPWKGQIPLVALFEEKFKVKALLTNDANAAAIGEKTFGVAKDLSDFVEITLGTGLGSGIIAQNELLIGKNGMAGEYGHIIVEKDGRICGCGRNGCLETYVSATGVVRSIYELESDNKSLSNLTSLENPSAKDVFDYSKKGDLFALEIVNYTAEILGNALANFAAFSDPQAYVLFGGLSKNNTYFSDKVYAAMNQHILNIYKDKIEIRNSSLNESNAAVLGATACVFWDSLKITENENL